MQGRDHILACGTPASRTGPKDTHVRSAWQIAGGHGQKLTGATPRFEQRRHVQHVPQSTSRRPEA